MLFKQELQLFVESNKLFVHVRHPPVKSSKVFMHDVQVVVI